MIRLFVYLRDKVAERWKLKGERFDDLKKPRHSGIGRKPFIRNLMEHNIHKRSTALEQISASA